MKRIFILLPALLSLFAFLPAQSLQNGGFEQQTITSNDTVPTGWSVDQIGFQFSPDAHSGNYAMQVWNWYYYAKGWTVYGDANFYTDLGGQPINFVPDRLNGWYKYILGDNGGALDSAFCEVIIFSRQNFTGARDTLVHEVHKLGPATEYTSFEVTLNNRNPGIIPDSLCIRFLSSDNGFCSNQSDGNCLYLTVDDLEVSSATGFSQSLDEELGIKLFPNPSQNGFQLMANEGQFPMQISIHDLQGRMLGNEIVKESQFSIGSDLQPGTYFVRILDAGGRQSSQKFQQR